MIIILLTFIVIAYPLFLLIKWGLIFFEVGKDYKPLQTNLSGKLHEPPSDLKPYYVDTLTNRTLTPSGNSISSTILYLIKLKYIKISYKDKWDTLGNRKRNYYLELDETKAKDITKLSKLEQRFLAFIFQGVGNIATFSEIKSYGIRKASVTHEFWGYWKDQVVYELVKKEFIDKNSYFTKGYIQKELFAIGTVIVYSLYFGIKSGLTIVFVFSAFMFTIHIILQLFKLFIYKRSDIGNKEYSKWLDFKSWLEDYSVTKNYPIDSMILWEDYLMYGMALGVSKKALSELPINYDSWALDESPFGDFILMQDSVEGPYDMGMFISEVIEFSSLVTGAYANVEKEAIKIEAEKT